MFSKRKFLVASFSAFLAVFIDISAVYAVEKDITIGTAGVTGVYYPAGGAICRMVNRGRKEHNIRCAVESTGGSIANLEAIHNKDIELGIVQSDLLYYAYNGKGVFADVGSDKNLRVLLSLHSEPFTILARKQSGIKSFDDLRGKKIYTGSLGSGMRAAMDELIEKKGFNKRKFASIINLRAGKQGSALCQGKVDAIIYAGGHPNGILQEAASLCSAKLVGIGQHDIDMMVKDNPFYSEEVIPSGMYSANLENIKTFGVRALLVASADLDEEAAYEIVKAVFENLDNFKTLHPVFTTLDMKNMVANDNVAPLHLGAVKYYREKGLLKE
ncbi:MAG: TAXI family TRAP transporter solute-binding subunit [Rickettsiales bacterium]